MRNLLIALRFVGTRYHGFQVQANAPSVCAAFQDAAEALLGFRWDVKGCSRTDAGVHANRYYLSMRTDSAIPCAGLVRGLNTKLPPDIAAVDCVEVPLDFHARYDCLGKRYLYVFYNHSLRDPFWEGRAFRTGRPLDEARMDAAAGAFVGRHDFSAFCASGGSVEDKNRTIFSAGVRREGDLVTFTVEGDGFLYNMVRIMAGTLLEAGTGSLEPEGVSAILDSRRRNRAGMTLPPWGLYLDEVFYPESIFPRVPADLKNRPSSPLK